MVFDQQRYIYIYGNDTIQFHHSINNIGGRVIMEINNVANCRQIYEAGMTRDTNKLSCNYVLTVVSKL